MTVVINGTTGITNPNSMTIGNGGGSVASNTAVGASALAANTTGSGNDAFGSVTLQANTTGGNNGAFGRGALYSNTSGNNNTGLGYNSLFNTTTGASNTGVGNQALFSNTTASNNTAVGYQAGYANTTGSITAVGYFAGKSNTTATNNTAIGTVASYLTTTGGDNTSLGYGALYLNSTGGSNTAIGSQALLNNTASTNTAVGYQAGYSNTAGATNVFIGHQAGYTFNLTSSADGYNTFLGQAAGYYVTTGLNNTLLGRFAGGNITTGSKNTVVGMYNGNQNGLDIRTANNYIVLSDGDGYPRVWIDGNGRVAFPFNNSGAASSGIEFSTDASYTYIQTYTSKPLKLNDLGNDVYIKAAYVATTATAANMVVNSAGLLARSTSSLKYKKNVQDAQYGLADVLNLRAVTYQAKDAVTKNDAGEDVTLPANEQVLGGLIAEEVHEAGLTQFVQYADDGTPDALAYANMASLFVKAIQELNAKIEAQAAEIAALKGQA